MTGASKRFSPDTADLMRLHYDAAQMVHDSTILAIALVDKAGGPSRAWTRDTGYSYDEGIDYPAIVKRGSLHVKEEDRDAFLQALDLHHVLAMVEQDQRYTFEAELDLDGKRSCLKYHFASYQPDPNYLFEVIEDATKLLEAEANVKRASVALNAALKAANQIGYEYDPTTHVAIRLTEDSSFDLPKRFENCPDSLKDAHLFHPDDAHLLFQAFDEIDRGATSAHCDVRIMAKDGYRWFSCEFNVQYDLASGHNIATILLLDVTLRVTAMKSFEDRLEALLYKNDSALSVAVFNLTQGIVKELRAQRGVFSGEDLDMSYEEALQAAASGIRNPADRAAYLRDFSRESLIASAQSGQTRQTMRCLYRIEPGYTEWVEVSAEVFFNPVTREYESIGYTRSVNELHLASKLVEHSLSGPYSSTAVLVDQGEEFYLYNVEEGRICSHMHDFWTARRQKFRELCTPEEFERISPMLPREYIMGQLEQGINPKFAFDVLTPDGEKVRLENTFTWLEQGSDLVLGRIRNITDDEMVARLKHDSRHDALTGLYNRQTTFAKCQEILEAHTRAPLAMMKLNVRRFRMFNDFFGEDVGDEFLRAIAEDLLMCSHDYEYCAFGRIEADVFCAFFPYDEELLKRHLRVITQRFKTFRDDFLLEPSIGLYMVNDRSLSVEGMFARASTAAKEGGTRITDVVSVYNDELERNLEEEIRIVNEMQGALDHEQFAVYLQPKYNLMTGEHVGAEALVRWIRPGQGVMLPGKFIPVFEGNGFITSLDKYMWEHVCMLLRKWLDQGGCVRPVSVNLSRLSAYSPSTVPFLKDLVRRYNVDPALLELELTESAYIGDPETIKDTLGQLQAAGFKILMDDFGSGYSSLNTLRDLPVDVLKLDMGFLSKTGEDDERGRIVISSVMDMTKRLGLPVIAEGVETESQASYLRSIGCEYVQGFYFARPMPVADYEKLR